MAKMTLPLHVALSLHQAISKARAGQTVALQDIGEAVEALFPELDDVCSTIEPWQQCKTTSGVDNLVMAGPGWKVSYKIASDTGEPETALIDRDKDETFVLDGDHRDAFLEAREGGMPHLLQTYLALAPKHASEFTTSLDRNYFAQYGIRLDASEIVVYVYTTQLRHGRKFELACPRIEKIEEMAKSIRACGKVNTPLRVVTMRSQPGVYKVVDGDLRLSGIRRCKMDGHLGNDFMVPVIVVGDSEDPEYLNA